MSFQPHNNNNNNDDARAAHWLLALRELRQECIAVVNERASPALLDACFGNGATIAVHGLTSSADDATATGSAVQSTSATAATTATTATIAATTATTATIAAATTTTTTTATVLAPFSRTVAAVKPRLEQEDNDNDNDDNDDDAAATTVTLVAEQDGVCACQCCVAIRTRRSLLFGASWNTMVDCALACTSSAESSTSSKADIIRWLKTHFALFRRTEASRCVGALYKIVRFGIASFHCLTIRFVFFLKQTNKQTNKNKHTMRASRAAR